MQLSRFIPRSFAFSVAAFWTFLLFALTTTPITISGSGYPAEVVNTLGNFFILSAIINGALVAFRVRLVWVVVILTLQRIIIGLIMERSPDWFTLYSICLMAAGLLLIAWLAGLFERLLNRLLLN